MIKCFGLVMVLLFFSSLLFAQHNKYDSSKSKGLKSFAKLSISWDSGLEWEQKISKTSVIDFFGGITTGSATDGFSFSDFLSLSQLGIVPSSYVEYRNYYNIQQRVNKKIKTDNNSANFLFGTTEVYFPINKRNSFNLLFIQGWGLQRALGKKINLTCHLGVTEHFYFDKYPGEKFNYIKLEPKATVSISYIF